MKMLLKSVFISKLQFLIKMHHKTYILHKFYINTVNWNNLKKILTKNLSLFCQVLFLWLKERIILSKELFLTGILANNLPR